MGYNKANNKSRKFWKNPIGSMAVTGQNSIPAVKKKIKILP